MYKFSFYYNFIILLSLSYSDILQCYWSDRDCGGHVLCSGKYVRQ